MARVTKALAKFGVLQARQPGVDHAREVLDIADDYRRRLCDLYYDRHMRIIDFRNATFPELYAAMVESEAAYWRISAIEREIKALHTEKRDRNAVTRSLRAALTTARRTRVAAKATIIAIKPQWVAVLTGFKEWWRALEDWKNVKTLAKRRALYAAIVPPDGPMGDYARIIMELDLAERDLDAEFSPILHYAVRGEIKDASQPKLTASAPGIRYRYGRRPEPRPWRTITTAVAGGGMALSDVLAGRCPYLRLQPMYRNDKYGGAQKVYRVTQRIGTAADPRELKYVLKVDKPLQPDAVLKRWSLQVDGRNRDVIVICDNIDVPDPAVPGTVAYKLRWTSRPAGVEVAHIWGDNVNERVIVPHWILDRIFNVSVTQVAHDNAANRFLTAAGFPPLPRQRQGMAALEAYVANRSDDSAAATMLRQFGREMHLARKDSARASRAIEAIYSLVVARVRQRHSSVVHDDLDLAKLKRYDTRDLLKADKLPKPSREILHAVSPGKLRLRFKQAGLVASDAAPPVPPDAARETDLFTSYVRGMGTKTGTVPALPRRRSQICDPAEAVL